MLSAGHHIKMDIVKYYAHLCRCLNLRDKTFIHSESLSSADWEQLLCLAWSADCAPAVFSSLREKDSLECMPKSFYDIFELLYLKNSNRNLAIRQQTLEILNRFEISSIETLLLKGAVHLFESTFDDLGWRTMVDIDLLVREDKFAAALDILTSMGYLAQDESDIVYCSPPLFNRDLPSIVELHIYVGEQRGFLSTSDAWRTRVETNFSGSRILYLSPTNRLIHNIFHSEIQDRGYNLGYIKLKQLHDLVRICNLHSEAIDWESVRDSFERNGSRDALDARLYLAHHLLGLQHPLRPASMWKSKAHCLRCFLQMRWKSLDTVVRYWGAATHAFRKNLIDLRYNCGTSFPGVHIYRIRRGLEIASTHRGAILAKILHRKDCDDVKYD